MSVPVNKVHKPVKVATLAGVFVTPPVQSVEVMLDVSVRDLPPQTFLALREFA